jgi:WD40 repeat protein
LLAKPIKHPANVFSTQFSPDGQRLLTACRDGQARVFNWRTGRPVLRGLNHERDVLGAAFTLDGRHILTVGLDSSLRTWSADDGHLAMRPHRVSFRDREILVTPDSRFAVVTGVSGQIHVVSLAPLQQEPETNAGYASLLGELVSNRTIHDGGTVKLTTSEWLERWDRWSD